MRRGTVTLNPVCYDQRNSACCKSQQSPGKYCLCPRTYYSSACIGVISYMVMEAALLGIVLAAIMLVKGAAYRLVLCAGSVLLQMRHLDSDSLLPFYAFVALGGIAGLLWLLKHVTIKS